MISTATIRERPLLSHSDLESSCKRSWPDKVTVDISLLLKSKDEEEPDSATSKGTTSGSPSSVTRSVPTPVSFASSAPSRSSAIAGNSSVPTKRTSRPFDHPSSESPAKKQSKWSAEEDAKIIQLRGDGMKWEDISKHLPGRSAISCRLHYQNYLERRSEWDEDRKNKLARLYERFKADMWSRIAEEMAIPWRAAEAMHWQMGEHEMARRAGVTPFSLTTNSSQTVNTLQSTGIAATRAHHIRSNSATPRLRRDSAPQVVQLPPQVPPQLPSLAELTAGLPAYSPHGSHPLSNKNTRSYHGALTPPHLYHHPSSLSSAHSQSPRHGHDYAIGSKMGQGYQQGPQSR